MLHTRLLSFVSWGELACGVGVSEKEAREEVTGAQDLRGSHSAVWRNFGAASLVGSRVGEGVLSQPCPCPFLCWAPSWWQGGRGGHGVTCLQLPGGGKDGHLQSFPLCSGLPPFVCPGRLSAALLLLCLFLGPEAKLVLCSHVTVARRAPLLQSPSFHQNRGFRRRLGHGQTRARSPFTGAPGSAEAAEGPGVGNVHIRISGNF